MQLTTIEKVEDMWNSMNLALIRVIQNWEQSGQGNGEHTGDVNNNTVGAMANDKNLDEMEEGGNGGNVTTPGFGSLAN